MNSTDCDAAKSPPKTSDETSQLSMPSGNWKPQDFPSRQSLTFGIHQTVRVETRCIKSGSTEEAGMGYDEYPSYFYGIS